MLHSTLSAVPSQAPVELPSETFDTVALDYNECGVEWFIISDRNDDPMMVGFHADQGLFEAIYAE